MPKFLGVISNSDASHPSDDRVLEFTDLDLLANFLYNETENLFQEFRMKLDFIKDRETRINENSTKLLEINNFQEKLASKTLEIERDTDQVGCLLCRMEQSIDYLTKMPIDSFACKCKSNLELDRTLQMLVEVAANINTIDKQLDVVKLNESAMPAKDPCDLAIKLLPFLDLHVKILEQIERKTSMISDLLNEVDRAFIFIKKKLAGDCIHKVHHEYTSDC